MISFGGLIKKIKTFAPVRLIVSSFVFIIIIGTILLMLPVSARNGRATPFIDALFTSVSATCVTGLVVFDTWTHWNEFGQAVILLLIQVGGLGVITFTTGFTLLVRRRLGLRDVQLAMENTSGNTLNIYHLVRTILAFTLSCEFVGALLLSIRFVPQFGSYGVWIAVFEAVSAYCNAGFDILGFRWKDGSLIGYTGDPLVSLVIAALIITGGLGFIVITDVFNAKLKTRFEKKKPTHLSLHSTIVLLVVPLVFPVSQAFGVDPIHFGVITCTNLAMGMFTPPFGANVFLMAGMGHRKVASVFRAAMPLILTGIVMCLIVTYVPFLSTMFIQ